MTERTLAERLRAIAEPRFSPLFPEEVAALHEAAAALERLEKLEKLEDQLLARERQLRDALAEVESFINGYGGSPDARAALATPAPAPQKGGA